MAKWNTTETPDNTMLDDGIYRLNVENVEETGGTDEDPRPLAIEVTFTVEEPTSSKGFFVRRRFWLGSKEDPRAESPSTRRSKDWVAYKNFLKACGVSPSGDTEEEALMLKDGECLGKVGLRRYRQKTDAEGQRTGMANTVYSFYQPGTKDVGYANGLDKVAADAVRSNFARERGIAATPTFGDDE